MLCSILIYTYQNKKVSALLTQLTWVFNGKNITGNKDGENTKNLTYTILG